ncbi:3-carboxy-cis,cis-muconate cycloisomerase [Sphaerisporangium sp. TRM90804]|uniref:3-carboxy-cis,cis-muconate cycloisomerase n=1 Tax=Sphaerisporangium sp. TRM90804 TaxID=3031113 RepID=UPI00244C2865|nr:3-carboxy-cis,cis-muconate cycloisomerase [Sphaerisporangium sp. TRM90804]MDH2429102.1 3-carboxy-cis,cis-muconate cycloisomerase [Sphaerisporangium sp. TRM90804]
MLGSGGDGESSVGDVGLLSPVWAGTAVEAAVSDRAFLRGMLDAEAALARAQAGLGIVPVDAAEGVTRLCRTVEIDAVELARRARGAGNPVVPLLAELRGAAGELGPYIHLGATSQDIVDSALMVLAFKARTVILDSLGWTLDALAGLAEAHRHTPMAGRTLGQHAVPVAFGAKAGGWLLLVLDARDALAGVRLPAQLGGAAGTLEGLGPVELMDAFADELGLARPVQPWHTRRTAVAGLGAALATTAGALGKIAGDVVLMAQNEVGELAEPAAPGRGGSSAMPHKRNPVLSILVRSAALQVPVLAQILQASLLSEHERAAGAWHAEWMPLRECLRLTGGAAETAAELVAGVEVFPDRMRANLEVTGELSGGLGASDDLVTRALEEYGRRR